MIKNIIEKIICAVFSISLFGCTSVHQNQQQQDNNYYNNQDIDQAVNLSLGDAANAIDQKLTSLNQIEAAANPPQSISAPPLPSSYGLDIPVFIDWEGSLEPLMRSLVNHTDYHLEIWGVAPATPILISIHAHHQALGYVFQEIGLQAEQRAAIIIYPHQRIIAVRYRNLDSSITNPKQGDPIATVSVVNNNMSINKNIKNNMPMQPQRPPRSYQPQSQPQQSPR